MRPLDTSMQDNQTSKNKKPPIRSGIMSGTGKARAVIRALPLVVIDVFGTIVAYLLATWGGRVQDLVFGIGGIALYLALLAIVNVVVFAIAKMYTTLWEYAGLDEASRLAVASIVGTALGGALAALTFNVRLPWRVYIIGWAILLIISGAARFAIRLYSGRKGWSLFGVRDDGTEPRSIIVGAGETGGLTASRMLSGNPDIPGVPVGFVDDDLHKVGSHVHGVKVYGTVDDLPQIAEYLSAQQIVIACPAAVRGERGRILDICTQTGLKTLTLPALADFPHGAGARIPVRQVDVTDLLARDEVELDMTQMGYVSHECVLVTGGGGSIGSELVRQLLPAHPRKIVVFDIYENTAYELYHELGQAAAAEGTQLVVEIGSITNPSALRNVFDEHAPKVVFHAAAHKHVPLMERNVCEAVENNVFGTLNVVRIAHELGCSHFVLISTDKAVNPTNVMGATKRMCEMVVQNYAANSDTIFAAVRFGNVLGSHGSVIPLFRRQLDEGGPITVTHPDITRYFMTIPEASRLVITAGSLAKGGEIFVLDMGEPVRIYDLAENLIRLSGLRPGKDIEIQITGLRPGEKLHEELLMDDERLLPTFNPSIMISEGEALELNSVMSKLDILRDCLGEGDASVKQALASVVPTYSPAGQEQ